MTSLDENLPVLSELVPKVPGQLAEALGDGRAAQQAAVALLRQIEQRRQEGTELLERVRQALDGLSQAASERRQALQDAAGQADAAWDEVQGEIEQGRTGLEKAVDGAEKAMGELAQALSEGGTDCTAAAQEVTRALDAVEETIRTGQSELEAAVEAASGEVANLTQAMDAAKEALHATYGDLDGLMGELLERAEARLGQTLEKVRELASRHDDHVDGQGDRAKANATDVVEMMSETGLDGLPGAEPLKDAATAALEGVGSLLDALGAAALSARDVSRAGRETLDPLIDSLGEAISPLPRAVQSVQQAAEQVGVSWG